MRVLKCCRCRFEARPASHTPSLQGGWGTALPATLNICFCGESWWILNSCLLFQEREYSSLTLVAQPNNCNHRTQLFAWCVIILCSVLNNNNKKKSRAPISCLHECNSRHLDNLYCHLHETPLWNLKILRLMWFFFPIMCTFSSMTQGAAPQTNEVTAATVCVLN